MRRIISSVLVFGLLALSPVSAAYSGAARPRSFGSTYRPHFPSTKTRTITTGKLHYINPPKPKTR